VCIYCISFFPTTQAYRVTYCTVLYCSFEAETKAQGKTAAIFLDSGKSEKLVVSEQRENVLFFFQCGFVKQAFRTVPAAAGKGDRGETVPSSRPFAERHGRKICSCRRRFTLFIIVFDSPHARNISSNRTISKPACREERAATLKETTIF
jgi:hypothetical protein